MYKSTLLSGVDVQDKTMNADPLAVLLAKVNRNRGMLFGVLIVFALFSFEIFNFSTTEFALNDLLGDLSFANVRWATILAVAFCGIDFAGIARLLTPEQGAEEPLEVWYLFGAWLLAAAMNAMLTWWGVSIAILNHEALGIEVLDRQLLLKSVPIFVAVLVWLIRILIIGTFSVSGERLFTQDEMRRRRGIQKQTWDMQRSAVQPINNGAYPRIAPKFRQAPKPNSGNYSRPEPTYHPVAMSADDLSERSVDRKF